MVCVAWVAPLEKLRFEKPLAEADGKIDLVYLQAGLKVDFLSMIYN